MWSFQLLRLVFEEILRRDSFSLRAIIRTSHLHHVANISCADHDASASNGSFDAVYLQPFKAIFSDEKLRRD